MNDRQAPGASQASGTGLGEPSLQPRRPARGWRDRRRIAAGVLATAMLVLVSACGDDQSSESTSGEQSLVIATIDDLLAADNITLGGTANDRTIMGSTVYDPLFTTDENAESVPALATGAEPSPDAKTWTISLQEGVEFSNGKAFTANDVKANFEAFLNPDNASSYASNLASVESIEVPDDLTVVFNLNAADARFPENLTDTMFISDLDARASGELLGTDEVPIGTGPYKWKSRQPGTSITFEPNPTYWRGEPPLDKVEFRAVPDPQQAALALQKGEIDMIVNNVPVQSLPALEEDTNIQILHAEGSYFFQAYLNFEKARRGGYEDADKVHLGLAYLSDVQTIVPSLIGDFGTPATQPIPSWQLGWTDTVEPYPYDEAKGVQLLEEGGISKGDPIDLLALADRPYLCDWATAMQSNLKKLGYDAKLSCQENEVIPPEITKYEWDMLFWTTSGRPTAATFYEQRWGVDATLPEPDDTYTLRDYDLQKLIDEMKATIDDDAYADLGAQIAERIVKTNAAVVPGYFQDVYILARSNVQGLKVSPIQYYGLLYNAMGKVTVDG